MNQANSIVQRQQLNKHRSWGTKFGIRPEDIRPQTLLLYARLAANKEQYMFDVSDKANSVVNIERRLKDSSLFFANLFGLGILKAPILAGPPVTEYPAAGRILHYPDKTIFAAAGSATTLSESQAVGLVYHAQLTMSTDQGIRLDAMSTEIFEQAPDLQSGAAAQPADGLNLVDLSTSFFIWGDRKNSFSLQLPTADRTNIGGTATGSNFVVLALGGFEVVNAANSSRAKDFARYAQEEGNR